MPRIPLGRIVAAIWRAGREPASDLASFLALGAMYVAITLWLVALA